MQPTKKQIDLKQVDPRLVQKLLADLAPAAPAAADLPGATQPAVWPAPFRAAGGKHASG